MVSTVRKGYHKLPNLQYRLDGCRGSCTRNFYDSYEKNGWVQGAIPSENLVDDYRRRKVWEKIKHLVFRDPKNSNELEEQTILNQEIVQLYKAIHQLLPQFPKTEHYTLINDPMELTVDEKTEIYIESSVESGKEIEVKVLNKKGSIVSEHVFIQNGGFTVAGSFIYHYQGNIKFPEKGTWALLINGEKTQPFKN